MGFAYNYQNAQNDFYDARRKASIEMVLARLSGKSADLIQYDDIRKRFSILELPNRELREIPLNAIIGSVGRYQDFSRTLLPLKESDRERWSRVRAAVDSLEGLPPIEVYKVGEVYFILDGHHRASIARELGAKEIQAYVREVDIKVPLSPDDQPDDIILKSEYASFLEKTHIDELVPNANVQLTAPGQYERLLEHIQVHRYFMGLDQRRDISFPEAVVHWYEKVYTPVSNLIRQRNLLRDFQGRTEADLYLWLMESRTQLEKDLGWKVTPATAAREFLGRVTPPLRLPASRLVNRLLRRITPDEIETGPQPGTWRMSRSIDKEHASLFENIMIAIPGDDSGWTAMDVALNIAQRENALLGGLHVHVPDQIHDLNDGPEIREKFLSRCAAAQVEGNIVFETGNITRILYDRSAWADLVVFRLRYPPPLFSFRRLGSGIRNLIRLCPSPLLIVPPTANPTIERAVLAYGGGRKADEALYLSAYLASRWGVRLTVTAIGPAQKSEGYLNKSREYLDQFGINDTVYLNKQGDPAHEILSAAEDSGSELIIMGGYEGGLVKELVTGSTVDRVLWNTRQSVLICH